MLNQLYRTNTAWLSDDQLLLLDALFDTGTSLSMLHRDGSLKQFNFGYTHSLDDAALEGNIIQLCEQRVLESQCDQNSTWYKMTGTGGELWSQERCPVWEKYCTERYKTTLCGRTQLSVVVASPEVRDHFLSQWPETSARRKKAVIADRPPLIEWRSFEQVYVGVATYDQHCPHSSTDHWTMLERERSWWRSVSELQKFVNRTA